MSQMGRNDVEGTVIECEIVGDATFVADHLTHGTLGYLCRIDVGDFVDEVRLDKHQKEHLPHVDEFARNRCKPELSQVALYLIRSFQL